MVLLQKPFFIWPSFTEPSTVPLIKSLNLKTQLEIYAGTPDLRPFLRFYYLSMRSRRQNVLPTQDVAMTLD